MQFWANIRFSQHPIQRVKVKRLSGRQPLYKKPGGPWSLCSQKGLTLGLERRPRTGQGAPRGRKQATSPLYLLGRSFQTLKPPTLFFLSRSTRSWFCGLCIPLSNALDLFTKSPLTLDFPLRSPLPSSPLQCKQLMSPDSMNFHFERWAHVLTLQCSSTFV